MDFSITVGDVADERGFWALAGFSSNNNEYVLELTNSIVKFSSQAFGLFSEFGGFCEGLEIAAAGIAIVNLPGDVISLVNQASGCAEAFASSGVTSKEFLSASANTLVSFGFFMLDLSMASLFLIQTRVISAVSSTFKLVASCFYGLAVVKRIVDNVLVISEGDKGKEGLPQFKKDLISANYEKNWCLLVKNLSSLCFATASIASIALGPAANLALMVVGVSACGGDFLYKREMQHIVAETALGKSL